MKTINTRTTEYPIDDIFLKRYSPRAMSGESLTNEELMTLFDAARWAPSAGNRQPWRFVYAVAGTPDFDKFLNLLEESNREWSVRAGVLIVTISKNTKHDGTPYQTHSFDTGAAWENLALQAAHMSIVCHGMGGFDYDRAKTELGVGDDHTVEMMIALGKPGKVEDLSEKNQTRETPNTRKPLEEIVFEGNFPA